MDIYYDAEFDAVRSQRGCTQCLISLGMIAAENGKVIDRFYSLIHPKKFRKLSGIVRKMTHLNSDEIRYAPSFHEVMIQAEDFLNRYLTTETDHLYSFGPDDHRTMIGHAHFEQVTLSSKWDQTIDLQRELSREVIWKQAMISSTLSLDDCKYVFGMDEAVMHNALDDAMDLMRIHEASRKGNIKEVRVKDLYERKQKRLAEVKQRRYERMIQHLHMRYDVYDGVEQALIFYPDVIENLMRLSKQESLDDTFFTIKGILFHQELIAYEDIAVTMKWHMCEIPSVCMHFQSGERCWSETVVLNDHNGHLFQAISALITS